MSRLIASCLIVLLWMTSAPAHARDWVRAELPGVVFYSDGYSHELQRWALKFRLFDALLRQQFGVAGLDRDPGSPLTIYLLDEGKQIERLTGRENLQGLYSPSIEGSFLIASRDPAYDKRRLSGQMSLFHEYAHHFMYRHFTSAWPVWYREGFAEYASAVTFDADRKATVGLPNWPRLKHLDDKPMPLKTVLTATVDDFKPGEKARFYAWSWNLVHLLMETPADRRRLAQYLRSFGSGTDSWAAAQAAFGDLAALEARLHAHVPDPRGGKAVAPTLTQASEVAVTTLDPIASRLIDLRLERLAGGDRKAALERLQAFVEANPANPEARRELALALSDTNLPEARSQALMAMSLAPDDLRARAIWADIAFRQIKANPASMPSDWDKVRSMLSGAIRPDTRDPMALALLFRSYLLEPRRPNAAAHLAMARAMALQPESYEVRSLAVYSLALQGRAAQARRTALMLTSDPHSGALGKRVEESLDRAGVRASN